MEIKNPFKKFGLQKKKKTDKIKINRKANDINVYKNIQIIIVYLLYSNVIDRTRRKTGFFFFLLRVCVCVCVCVYGKKDDLICKSNGFSVFSSYCMIYRLRSWIFY
jgi:hypothetical protein